MKMTPRQNYEADGSSVMQQKYIHFQYVSQENAKFGHLGKLRKGFVLHNLVREERERERDHIIFVSI